MQEAMTMQEGFPRDEFTTPLIIQDPFRNIQVQNQKNEKSITLPKVINKKDRPGDIRFNSLSTSHTKKELKWANKTSIDLGLKKTIDWFLSNK